MRTFQYVFLVYIGLNCLVLGLCSPTRSRSTRSDDPNTRSQHANAPDRRRARSSGKRLKVLQKMLKQLQPEDIGWLLRQKKFAAYSPELHNHKDKTSFSDKGNEIESSIYNIPNMEEIECPVAEDGMPLFACPTPDQFGIYRCIDEHALCDNHIHCPHGEDEDRTICMFHRMTMRYFKVMMDAMYGLTRSLV